jgi:hypothetical protein
METIRRVVLVNPDRKVEITLPDKIEPGLAELVIMVKSMSCVDDRYISTECSPRLFGFLLR